MCMLGVGGVLSVLFWRLKILSVTFTCLYWLMAAVTGQSVTVLCLIIKNHERNPWGFLFKDDDVTSYINTNMLGNQRPQYLDLAVDVLMDL